MNFTKAMIMAASVALIASTSCTNNGGGDLLIGKPEIKVENKQFTPEVLNAFGRVGDPQVSPDGTRILYGVQYQSVEQNKGNRELWVMDIDGNAPVQLTKTPNSESNAVWINGGTQIAFIYTDESDENAKPQMWVMNADGSKRHPVSTMENGIEGFIVSPDGTKVILISCVKYFQTKHDYEDLDKSKARIIDDLMYRHWNEWVTEIPHPFVADFDGGAVTNPVDLLEGTQFESPMRPWGGIEQLAWTPDSKQIIYVCRKKVGREYSISTNSDLYLYTIADKKTENLTEGMMGYDNNPIVSKSGKLAWLSMEHDGYEADKNRIFLMEKIGGEKKDLTADWDYSVDAIAWSPDEKYIYFICPYQGTQPIFRIDVATQKIDTVASGQYDYAALAFAGDKVVTLRHSFLEPNELFTVKTGEQPKQISHVNDDLLAQIDKVECHKEMVPTTDGKQMVTWVLTPPNFDPNKKYPALLFCEGGPQSPVSQFWSYRWNLRIMANHGYVVIAPNRRGLPGFGTEWNAQISGDHGGQNMKDYLSAVDYMKQKPYIDADHIGATGASYGGFSVYWLAGNHNKRFAAFLAHAGIFNIMSQYLETEEMWFENWELGCSADSIGGAYWNKQNPIAQKSYVQGNPANYVQNWDTPIMCTTGDNDFRISYTQTMQAFNAARLLNLPARMILFPDEDHWVQKPQNSVLWQREFFRWFDSWLMPDSKEYKENPFKQQAQGDTIKKQ